jgi:hypothetical protein
VTEPPSSRSPLGIPISRSTQIPSGRAFDPVRRALEAIDSVHGDGALPLLPVIRTRGQVRVGAYEWNEYTGEARRLSFSSLGEHPELSVVHEIGHFLDHQVLGRPGTYASETGGCVDVMEAIGQSAAVRSLVRLRGRRVVLLQVRHRRESVPVNQRLVAYLLTPREQLARAYAQYIALVSGSSDLRAQLQSTRQMQLSAVYHSQWDDDDFESIRSEFERLLRSKRWMTSS